MATSCLEPLSNHFDDLVQEDSHITKVALMARGIFTHKLSTGESASGLVSHSLIMKHGKIISLVLWYRGFHAVDFSTQYHIPHYPVTHLFPRLAMELMPYILDFGAHFGWVMQDSFAAAMVSAGVPSVGIAMEDPFAILEILEIETHSGIMSQRIMVTGQPNQCLKCHSFGN